MLKADKMLTGNAERFREKIIIILRLVDVGTETIEKSAVMEFVNQQPELQRMIRITVNNLVGIENDQNLVDLLANFDTPVTSSQTTLKLNGNFTNGCFFYYRQNR